MHWTARDRDGNPIDGNGADGIPAGDLAAMLAAKGHTDIRIGGHAVSGPHADVDEPDDGEPLVDASAYPSTAAAPCKGHRTDHGPHYRPGRSYCIGPCDGAPDGRAAEPADEPVAPTRRRRDKAPAAAAPEPAPQPEPDPLWVRQQATREVIREADRRNAAARVVDDEVRERGRARDADRDAKRHTEPTADERADQQRVIDAARRLAAGSEHGTAVHMADLRAALPDMSSDRFEDTINDLHHRPDVYMYPHTGPGYYDLDRRRQGVSIGPSNDTALDIRPQDVSVEDVVAVVRAADRRRTATALDGVPDYMLDNVAERIGAPVGDTPEQTRTNIVDMSVANDERQHAQWEQQRLDGTLLYRADNEPEWVATWTDGDRAAARAAAERAAADTGWEAGAARGRRWLEALDAG